MIFGLPRRSFHSLLAMTQKPALSVIARNSAKQNDVLQSVGGQKIRIHIKNNLLPFTPTCQLLIKNKF